MDNLHIKDVLYHVKLMAPYSEFQESAQCQYFVHTLSTPGEVNCLIWKVVHCKKPAISAVEKWKCHCYSPYDWHIYNSY